jgi:hypothetical protein
VKLLLSILISYVLVTSIAMGGRLNGYIEIVEPRQEVSAGELARFKLTMWPISVQNIQALESAIMKRGAIEKFYVQSVDSVGFSENNYQALEIYLMGIFLEPAEGLVIQSDNASITIPLRGFQVIPLAQYQGEHIILSIGNLEDSSVLWLVIVVLVLLMTGLWVYRKFAIKRKQKLAKIESERRWREIIKGSTSRHDYEYIWENRAKIVKVFPNLEDELNKFSRIANVHIYKKEWTQIEQSEIEHSVRKIREQLEC